MSNSPNWRKSSYSGSEANCVEVGQNHDDVILVRDTKHNGLGPVQRYNPETWRTFLETIKTTSM